MSRSRIINSVLSWLAFLPVGIAVLSCSTASRLPEGAYELGRNKVTIHQGDESLSSAELAQYIRQQPAAFSFKLWSDPVVFNSNLLSSSEDNMEAHLRYLGYYNSEVSSAVTYRKSKADVTYDVQPGERYKISAIDFDMPQNGPFAADFYADTANVSIKVGDYLSEKALESESERCAAHMRTLGYYGFSKNYFFFEADTLSGRDSVRLLMQVREYTRNESQANARPLTKSRISDVTISHSDKIPFRSKVLKDLNMIKPGDLYDESVVNVTYDRLSNIKLFNSVGIELSQVDTGLVRCDINLGASRVQGFNVGLEASTNSSGLMGVSPQLSYYHKNIFHGGEWLNLSFLGNFQFKFNDNTRSDEFGVSAGLSLPRFLGLENTFFSHNPIPRTEINAAYNYQNRPEYTRSIISTSLGYSGRIYGKFSYQLFPLQFNVVRLYNLDDEFSRRLDANPFMKYSYQNHFDAGVGGVAYYTTSQTQDDSFFYTRLSLDLSGNVIGLFKSLMRQDGNNSGLIWGVPYTQYVKGELTLGRTLKLGENERQAIAARLLAGAGYAYGNSTALPFEKQFYCGGANSMRGWQARALGPGSAPLNEAFIIPSQTGDLKLEANLEYRFDMFWKLGGAVFTDVGNVWSLLGDDAAARFHVSDFYKSLAADWGVGLRCDLNFLVVRIDMGFKLYDPSYQIWRGPSKWLKNDGFAAHFGVGYPF